MIDSISLIAPGIWKIRLGEPETVTPVSVRQSHIQHSSLVAMPAVDAPPFEVKKIQLRKSARGSTLTLPMSRDEGVYGLGLQLKSHLQSRKKKTLRVNSDPVADTGDSHAPVPFYVSTAGYGVLVDTCRYAAFYAGTHAPADQWQARAAEKRNIAQGNNPATLYQPRAISDRMVVDIPVAQGVDVYLFAGPTLTNAVQRYNLFSGGGCLPPLWGLGGWYRCHGQSTAAQVLALGKTLRDEQLPFTVLGLEPGWQTRSYPCSFVWAPERFPDAESLTTTTAEMGFRLNLWEHVFVDIDAPFAQAIRPYCADEMAFDGLIPDLLIPEAQNLFAQHHEETLIGRGISGFKLDECDHSDFIFWAWSFPEFTQFPSGVDGEQMHSLLGIRYQETIDSVFRKQNRRHYSEVRSSHALAAPQPFVLYSDLYDFRDFLRGVVNAGFSGLLWCPEVREARTLEELIRRIQAVALSSQALINAWYIRNPPWHNFDVGKNNEGVEMPEAARATALVRQAFELRMRLLPTIYTAFARYQREGLPPFRALVMDDPDDRATWEIDDQFLIGDSLLVAPGLPGQTDRTLYLPPGIWHDFHTRERHEGGKKITVPSPLETIPLFVRDGSILPLAEPVQRLDASTIFKITPTVFGTDFAKGVLYEDDGETYAFERGDAAWIELSWSKAGGGKLTRSRTLSRPRYEMQAWDAG